MQEKLKMCLLLAVALYIQVKIYMHYSFMGKLRLPFIDSGLLYGGALLGRFDCLFMHFLLVFAAWTFFENKIMLN